MLLETIVWCMGCYLKTSCAFIQQWRRGNYKKPLGLGALFLRLRTAERVRNAGEGVALGDYGVIGSPPLATELRRCQLHAPVFIIPNWFVSMAKPKKAWPHEPKRTRIERYRFADHCVQSRVFGLIKLIENSVRC